MIDYSELAAMADTLLQPPPVGGGYAVTVKYITSGAYDPATGSVSQTITAFPTVGYVDDYSDRDVDGTMVLRGDRRVYLSAVGATKPSPSDRVSIDGVDYAVIHAKAIPGAGTPSLFDVQIRR